MRRLAHTILLAVICGGSAAADDAPALRTRDGHSNLEGNYEIAQTRDVVLIRAEMNNYARIIRIGGRHIDPCIGVLHGDSIGQWKAARWSQRRPTFIRCMRDR